MVNLALLDLVRPYLLRGENLGPQHAALSLLRVVSYETAADAFGVAVRGRCEFNGWMQIDPLAGGLRVTGGVDEAAAAYDPSRRAPVFDIRETAVEFELFVPREGSAIVAQGVAGLGAPAAFAPRQAVLDSLAAPAPGGPPSDYPSTAFTLDLILSAPTVRPPFLHPAKLSPEGMLMPDTAAREVSITLPRLRFRLSHGNAIGGALRIELVSAGTTSLDDPGDSGVAELISMTPPYAYVGGPRDRVFGIGFRSATLDLSNDYTPAALKDKAGVGDDWTGLYLPEVRAFFSPAGQRDFAFEAGAKELLVGLGESGGIWGDFEAALVDQGSGELHLSARFVDEAGVQYGIERTTETTATARIPARTRMVVDVVGGRTPYDRRVRVGTAPEDTGAAFVVDLAAGSETIVIRVSDASATPVESTLTISAERRTATPALSTPGPQQAPDQPVVPGAATGEVTIGIATQNDTEAVFATVPPDTSVFWRVDEGAETGPQASVTVAVAVGSTHTIRVRKPGTTFPSSSPFMFYFDEPEPREVSTQRAISKLVRQREGQHRDPIVANHALFDQLANASAISIVGQASFEGDNSAAKRRYNYLLARRRAEGVRDLIAAAFPGKGFAYTTTPDQTIANTEAAAAAQADAWVTATGWMSHGAPNERDWWRADVVYPAGQNTPERTGQLTVTRPPARPPVVEIPPVDPQPETPATPSWFRRALVKLRVVNSEIIALEMECEIDIQTMSEERLRSTNELGSATPPRARTLEQGTPVGPDNPADGITLLRILCQTDPATGRVLTLMSMGADPADKDGLFLFGWMPGDPGISPDDTVPIPKDFGRTLLGSYLTFWPMLAEFPPVEAVQDAAAGPGAEVDVVLAGAALVIPGVIAALPWFQVERVVVFGAEYQQKDRGEEYEGRLLFDIGIDWSADLLGIIIINPHHPLSVRYKAIGLRFGNREDDGTEQFVLRPIFDSARGYTIDLASGGSLKLIEPLGQIIKILSARLSKSNPLTLEIDIGLGVDLGVVSIDRAGLRAYLDEPRAPELTALAATVDIPGALLGSGYVKIGKSQDSAGNDISTIGGQIDLTLRPISLRIAAAVEIAQIDEAAGGPATGVYVGLNVVLPVGIPLGTTGLGIFGFRGIFGMHYRRNPAIGAGAGVPALEWLKAADGQPHLLANAGVELWKPEIDNWAFGLGILIGTMEGGVILNLDGTFLLELPGPRVLIMMNARIVSPPPSLDGLGMSGGILAVLEITPEHFLIGILVKWDIEDLIKIVIPIEALFPFGADASKWHIYLGARPDLGQPVEVDVLGIVKGTGYLVFKGDGLPAYPVHNATLPAIKGFGIGLGVAASFTWGDTDIGLYIRIGGGMDAVLGFDPFVLAGTIWVVGELRLFIISIGAEAQLTVIVNEQPGGDLALYVHGEACGHVSFLFFEVRGCVDITISGPSPSAPMPALVEKVTLKSRSPALLAGTGVDRGIDASLGDAVPGAQPAAGDVNVPVVPIDVIPIVSMTVPPTAAGGLTVTGLGTPVTAAPGVPSDGFSERGGERYRYELTSVSVERIDPATGSSAGAAVQGSTAPVVWWTLQSATEPSPVAQLAFFTWEPSPATKAIEKTEHLVESIIDRWGTTCEDAAPPAEVLWTFRWEELGSSPAGWQLLGLAWPDPADTRRTTDADTALDVSERWRSGSAPLDAQRGIFPALVIGGTVPCKRNDPGNGPELRDVLAVRGELGAEGAPRLVLGGRGAVAADRPSGAEIDPADPVFGRLVRGRSQAPLRIDQRLYDRVASVEPTDEAIRSSALVPGSAALAETLRLLESGVAIGRFELIQNLGPLGAARDAFAPAEQENGRKTSRCVVKLLEAPLLDDGTIVVIGDRSHEETIAAQLEERGVTHGPLNDVVVLHTDGFENLDLLLFVPRKLLETEQLVVRAVGADDSTLDWRTVSSADLVWSRPLPARWTDSAGPWADDVADLLAWSGRSGTVPVTVHLDRVPDAQRVEIGVVRRQNDQEALEPAYYVAAVAMTRMAEVERHDWDDYQVTNEKSTLTNVLGPASSTNALLFADSLYRITVQAFGTRQGDGAAWGTAAAPESQAFWFRTDRIEPDPVVPDTPSALHFISTPPLPVRLDPWMLVTLPGDREKHAFGGEHVKLVFNTHDIERVLAAYGKEMRLRFQASSGRHPASTPEAPHPFPLVLPALTPSKGVVLSPWEDSLVQAITELSVVQKFCVPIDEDRSRHSEVDVPILLDNVTDYILDIELVDAGAAADARGPSVLRRFFSTGAYPTFGALTESLVGVRPRGRGADAGAFEAVRAHFAGRTPEGAEFDDQLQQKGIEPLEVPPSPRILVFWQQASPAELPQPAAVLIDATAPLRRTRPYPTKVFDDTGPEVAERWVLGPRVWLELQDVSASGVVAANGIIWAPGEQRALVVLAPNQRGTRLTLDLVDRAFPDLAFLNQTERRQRVVEVAFDSAPWEEV